MALTKTALTPNPRAYAPGMSEREYSVTFDSAYKPTNGMALSFGSSTNFKSKLYSMIVTKQPRTTNTNFIVELNPGTSGTASAAKIKLRIYFQTSSTNKTVKTKWATTNSDRHTISFRAIFRGY